MVKIQESFDVLNLSSLCVFQGTEITALAMTGDDEGGARLPRT
ncbi:hypothetical protein [Rhizobium laguerreae]|jgi:hypothetical protein|uniref:Uncharacterized protein n=1 Tax=Rhizobium laguerreae TaxID=1076926 RepID=A0AAX2QNZ6_9HYPH|nr:hypothetical protein [Rhizobium laguerreae]MBB3162692.1 hypothetical protein [Rhizobium laguerreae]TCU26212.1 hypothetical protein EV131_104362 [Rhizobium laguerreae]